MLGGRQTILHDFSSGHSSHRVGCVISSARWRTFRRTEFNAFMTVRLPDTTQHEALVGRKFRENSIPGAHFVFDLSHIIGDRSFIYSTAILQISKALRMQTPESIVFAMYKMDAASLRCAKQMRFIKIFQSRHVSNTTTT